MATGTIQTIRIEKGFGFIAPDEGGGDLFFHHAVVEGRRIEELQRGDRVEFEAGPDPRDPTRQRATHVRPITAAP